MEARKCERSRREKESGRGDQEKEGEKEFKRGRFMFSPLLCQERACSQKLAYKGENKRERGERQKP